MSVEADLPIIATLLCPHCGAEVQPEAVHCWLCGARQIEPAPGKPAATSAPSVRDQSRSLVVAIVVVAALGVGVVQSGDSLIIALFLIAVVPSLLVVMIGSTVARLHGRPWTGRKKVVVAATTAASAIASAALVAILLVVMAVLTAVSLVIALFAACIQALGGQT